MKTLKLIEKSFLSAAIAEERPFETTFKQELKDWNQDWVNIAFAEWGAISRDDLKKQSPPPPVVCELGDTSCFMHRNTK